MRLKRFVRSPAALLRRQPGMAHEPSADDLSFDVPEHLSKPPDDLLVLGEHTYGKPQIAWFAGDTGRVRVGRYCSLQDTAVIFVGGEHRPDWVTTSPLRELFRLPGRYERGLPATRGDVVIGNDVWLGYESLIRSGVTIGDGAIIAARSVVTRDVDPFAILAGNPARLVRYRFDEPTRQALLRIRWWDWPDEKVLANVDSLSSPDLTAFVAEHDPCLAPD